jgi:UDP-glucose 4-epimerase
VRDYIHVVDLADAHVASLEWMEGQPADPLVEVLNVGTGRGQSVLEAIDAFERATGVRVERRMATRRDGDIEQIWASCDKATRVLGWRATRSIDEAMRDAWRWQQRLSA